MATAALLVAETFAAGYATVDADWTLPPAPAVRIVCEACQRAADALDGHPAVGLYVFEAGARQAARTALHRARLRLYAHHRRLVVSAAGVALAGVDRRKLTAQLLALGGHTRQVRRDQAVSTLRSTAYGVTGLNPDWGTTNQAAADAAAARGYAEAEASPPGGGPPDPKTVAAGIAGAAAVIAAPTAGGWADQQISRQAWDLSGLDLGDSADTAEQAVTDSLDTLDGVGNAAEDLMHRVMTGAFSDYFNTGPGATLGQLAWMTEGDARVCPACDANEANGPYLPADVPDMPAHPTCRCSLELA